MGNRHQAREWAVQMLFQADLNPGDLDKAIEAFWTMEPGPDELESGRTAATAKMRGFTEDLIRGVTSHLEEIDRKLKAYAEHWDIHRMGAVDRSVMRVALYEMLYCPDIPPVVSINEAVDIAKDLSSMESGRFVNGILDRALKDLDRPARSAGQKKGTAAEGT